jgi:hypothetical protein
MNETPLYAEITIAALTGEISATCVRQPGHSSPASVSGIWRFERALPRLAEGGYVIDLRPLKEDQNLIRWVLAAPLPSGDIEGDEIDRLPEDVRRAAVMMFPFMEKDFHRIGFLMAVGYGKAVDRSPGAFDRVSSAVRAGWWAQKGARIGRRRGRVLRWMDGEEIAIESAP